MKYIFKKIISKYLKLNKKLWKENIPPSILCPQMTISWEPIDLIYCLLFIFLSLYWYFVFTFTQFIFIFEIIFEWVLKIMFDFKKH
jgi:hypothetical protein